MSRQPLPNQRELDLAVDLFAAMAHPGRLLALVVLHRRGPQSVSSLMQFCKMEQSALSHQLRILRDHNLVTTSRQGKSVIYALADEHVAHLIQDAVVHGMEPRARTRKRT